MTRILLVGGGITSAITGTYLRQKLPSVELYIWDKARGAGGRMSTTRNSKKDNSVLDLGAQYVSVTPEYKKLHSSHYTELKEVGLLQPLIAKIDGMRPSVEETEHFVAPKGISSIVKHFLSKSKADIRFNHSVESVTMKERKWEVRTVDGVKDQFDVVVLTMPVPQILGLSGSCKEMIETHPDLLKKLRSVEYSSRYALGMFFEEGSQVSLDNECCAQYFSKDPVVRFVSVDSLKRGSGDSCPSVVIHTSVPFGKANVEKTPADLQESLLARVQNLFPQWPAPESVKCQKWRFSQVTSAFPGLPGAIEIGQGLIATGDAFTHSNFDGCIEAGIAASETVFTFVKSTEGKDATT